MPNPQVRIPVGTLTDVEPIHRQLEPYYLMGAEQGYPFWPLEQVPERELENYRQHLEQQQRQRGVEEGAGTYAALMQRSLAGSTTFTRAELARGYRRISA
jgi:hypothetical protein